MTHSINLCQGIAYQLIDDILDFTGTSASLGKASFTDINQVIQLVSQVSLDSILPFSYINMQGIMYGQGIVTAPVLFAMEEFPQLREIVEQGFDDPSNVDVVCIETVPFPFFLVKMLQQFGLRNVHILASVVTDVPILYTYRSSNTFRKVKESRGRGYLLLNMQN